MSDLQAESMSFRNDIGLHCSVDRCIRRMEGVSSLILVGVSIMLNGLPCRSHEGVYRAGSEDAAPPLWVKGHQ